MSHANCDCNNAESESLQAQYREVRDSGKFTPTKVTPAPSIAVSVNDDEDVRSVDAAMFDPNRGSGSGDVPGAGFWMPKRWTVAVEESAPLSRPVPAEAGNRRCVDAGVAAPSVEAISKGRWPYVGASWLFCKIGWMSMRALLMSIWRLMVAWTSEENQG